MPDLNFLLKGAKGNGMTLGLTNGTQNAGLYNTTNNPNNYLFRTDNYGENVGYIGSSISLITDGSLGITLDSTKSGIISETSNNINYVIKY